jgi:hypothetical protein
MTAFWLRDRGVRVRLCLAILPVGYLSVCVIVYITMCVYVSVYVFVCVYASMCVPRQLPRNLPPSWVQLS